MDRDRVYKKTRERLPVFNGDLIIIILSIIIIMFGGYFYSYRSFENYILSKNELEDERIKLQTAEVRLKKLKEELEKEKIKSLKKDSVKEEKIYFSNIFDFKKKIDNFLESKEIEVISIASQEKEGERIYLSYTLEGKEEKLLQFLEKLESQHGAFTLLNAPVRMTDKNLEIKIGGYFQEAELLEEEKNFRKENIFSKREINAEYYPLGQEKGIVVLRKEGEYPKRILLKGEKKIKYAGEEYKLKIEKGGLKIQ